METQRTDGVLAWQWDHYREGHQDRKNLLVHILTQPVFAAGFCAVPLAVVTSPWLAPAGLVAMFLAMAAQGKTHKREAQEPAPFRGPGDFVVRLLAEQLVTFPRYVLSGAFRREWARAR